MKHPEQSVGQHAVEIQPPDLHVLGWDLFVHDHTDIARAARIYANLNLTPENREAFFHGVVFAHFIETIPIRQDQLAHEVYTLLEPSQEPPLE